MVCFVLHLHNVHSDQDLRFPVNIRKRLFPYYFSYFWATFHSAALQIRLSQKISEIVCLSWPLGCGAASPSCTLLWSIVSSISNTVNIVVLSYSRDWRGQRVAEHSESGNVFLFFCFTSVIHILKFVPFIQISFWTPIFNIYIILISALQCYYFILVALHPCAVF